METNIPLVSIIFPTYNVEKYLLECLESVNNQTYQNFEGIIIIDGAKDKSFEIAKEYCASHSKFKVYWQENAGSGPARNKGIERAAGELIMFVDPDDVLRPDLLEKLVSAQRMNNYDLTTSFKRTFIDKGEKRIYTEPKCKQFDLLSKEEVRLHHREILKAGYCSAPTRTLYKRSIIINNEVVFPPLRRSQDVVFNYRYFNYICSLKTIDYLGYDYRVVPGANARKPRPDYEKTVIQIYSDQKDMYMEWGIPFDEDFFCTHIFLKNLYSFLQICVINDVDIREIVSNNLIISNIIEKARPVSIFPKVVAILLRQKRYSLAEYVLKLRNKLK